MPHPDLRTARRTQARENDDMSLFSSPDVEQRLAEQTETNMLQWVQEKQDSADALARDALSVLAGLMQAAQKQSFFRRFLSTLTGRGASHGTDKEKIGSLCRRYFQYVDTDSVPQLQQAAFCYLTMLWKHHAFPQSRLNELRRYLATIQKEGCETPEHLDRLKAWIQSHSAPSAVDREVDESGRTALMHAAEEGQTEMCNLLLDRGASLEIRDADGRTALMHAACGGQGETCTLLLARGADLEVRYESGRTALMH